MDSVKILWADDEIDLLKPHILFLEQKGYEVVTTKSGGEVLDLLEENYVDLVFLDENMPGLSGLETLEKIKERYASLPVIMITKSEEEHIMEEAIGAKISDYLIKPVNPTQILLSIKKNIDKSRIETEQTVSKYQRDFRDMALLMNQAGTMDEWMDIYRKLVFWEMEMDGSNASDMQSILQDQKKEANKQFSRFIEKEYEGWMQDLDTAPILSHEVFKNYVVPELEEKDAKPLFLVVVDNLRYDQWKALEPFITKDFYLEDEEMYCSILPTTTQYARNALFSGLLPSDIERSFPEQWVNDHEEGNKNQHEAFFVANQLQRYGLGHMKSSYNKVLNVSYGNKVLNEIPHLFQNELNVIVYNFVDMLSHARTDTEIIRELAKDEAAYRSVTKSWFEHSSLSKILTEISQRGGRLILTTDHGSIRVQQPVKIQGDRSVNTNLRYKQGKSLSYNSKDVFTVRKPGNCNLPQVNMSQSFVFAKEEGFFAYPNNFNHYSKYYKDTFQHGGISMEEMLVPIVRLSAKK